MEKGRFGRCVAYSNFLNLPLLRSISPDSQGNSNRFQVLHLQTHWQQFGQREMDFSAHLWTKAISEDLTGSTVTKRTACLGCSSIRDVLPLVHIVLHLLHETCHQLFFLMIPSWGVRTMRWGQTCSPCFILSLSGWEEENNVTTCYVSDWSHREQNVSCLYFSRTCTWAHFLQGWICHCADTDTNTHANTKRWPLSVLRLVDRYTSRKL